MEQKAEGKTKRVSRARPGVVRVMQKGEITAFDGKKRDKFDSRAFHSNRTTCNVFAALKKADPSLAIAFLEKFDEVSFLARELEMAQVEVVARREAPENSGYHKRNPDEGGRVFEEPIVEFFFKDDSLGDPIIGEPDWDTGVAVLYEDKVPEKKKVGEIYLADYGITRKDWDMMVDTTRRVFLILERLWVSIDGMRLIDFKVEYGRDVETGEFMLGDEIENGSWRLWTKEGRKLDKDNYRREGLTEQTEKDYELVGILSDELLAAA